MQSNEPIDFIDSTDSINESGVVSETISNNDSKSLDSDGRNEINIETDSPGNSAKDEMTIECVAALYTTRSFIPIFVQRKPLLIFSIISSMLPPIADIMLDFINGGIVLH